MNIIKAGRLFLIIIGILWGSLLEAKVVSKQRYLEELAYRYPYHVQHQFNLAAYYEKYNRCDLAIPIYRQKVFNHSYLLHKVLIHLAKCYLKEGEARQAYDVANLMLTLQLTKEEELIAYDILATAIYPMHYAGISVFPKNYSLVRAGADKKKHHPVEYTFIPYAVTLNYASDYSKEQGRVLGAYLSFTSNYKTWEFFYEKTEINYAANLELSNLIQSNIGIFYSFFSNPKIKHRVGIHALNTTDLTTDSAFMLNYNLFYYPNVFNQFELGTYYSIYPSLNGDGESILQATLGFTRFNVLYDLWGKVNIIQTSFEVYTDPNSSKTLFISGELGGAYKWKKSKLSLSLHFGEKIFAVENYGLTLYNAADIYTLKEEVQYSYSFSPSLFTILKFTHSTFEINGSDQTSSSTATGFSLGYSF